jgi:predicted metal-dependent hydrolase
MAQKEITRFETDASHLSNRYTVRENPRAKHVHLKLSWLGQLEIVVPKGYNRIQIPVVIAAKQAWLERAYRRVQEKARPLTRDHFEFRPDCVRLRALDKTYAVLYGSTASARVRVIESGRRLLVEGPVNDTAARMQGLRIWLREKAELILPPWMRRTSRQLGLPYKKAIIRSQRTRWGSCSAQQVISLNCKLLFLPEAVVHYLFVHELCHTRHLDHSARYWSLVERKLPDYQSFEKSLRDTWRYVPRWAGD